MSEDRNEVRNEDRPGAAETVEVRAVSREASPASPEALRAAVPAFAALGEGPLVWLAGHGFTARLRAGERFIRQGEPGAFFYAQLEGRTEWTKEIGGQEVPFLAFDAGAVYGHEPILLDVPVPVSGYALTDLSLYCLPRARFWEMLGLFPAIVRELLVTLAQRLQSAEATAAGQAQLSSLGTLAAGLAHGLNNPAAAASRAVREAARTFERTQELALQLQEGGRVAPGPLARLGREAEERRRRRGGSSAHAARPGPAAAPVDPLEARDSEDAVAAWLGDHGVEDGWELAPAFAAAGLDAQFLDSLPPWVPEEALPDVLAWVEASLSTRELLDQAARSTARVSELVQAIKDYSFLDRAPLQEVDVHEGLDSTLAMLGHKIKEGAVTLERRYDPAVPRLWAYGPELNQVWTSLLDNALDAAGRGGRVTVRTAREAGRVLVEVGDDGPGIPEEARARIWDAFFTTKGVGEGTGMGLYTSRRIVAGRHKGDIRVESRPGDTRFQVRLPLDGPPQDQRG